MLRVGCLGLVVLAACNSAATGGLPEAGAASDASPAADAMGRDASGGDDLAVAGDGAEEDAAPRDADAGGRRDAAIVDGGWNDCTQPSDCAGRPPFPASRFCMFSEWSCISGRCTWECVPSRTCDLATDGCVMCGGDPPECPGTACVFPLSPMPMMEDSTCARAFLFDVVQCYGSWVVLRDGMLCSLEVLPTALVRAVLSCGFCQTTLVAP